MKFEARLKNMAGLTLNLKRADLTAPDGRISRVYGIMEENFRKKTLPKNPNAESKPAFRHDGCHFLLPKGCRAVELIEDAIKDLAKGPFKEKAEHWIRKNVGEGNATDNCALKDGDERDEVTADFADHFFLNTKSRRRILLVTPNGTEVGDLLDEDADGNEIDEGERVYSGMHIGALKINLWSYEQGKGGVACDILGWRGLNFDAEEMESSGGETATKDDLGFDEDDESEVKKPVKKTPPRKK